jgi:hypothetical protein
MSGSNKSPSCRKVMFGDKNLVDIVASNTNKFVTGCMSILYTDQELANGYIIDGPSTSSRVPLNLDKFQLLLGKSSILFFTLL